MGHSGSTVRVVADARTSGAIEDYLKAIFNLAEWAPGPVSNGDLAARLRVSSAAASEMVRRLADRGLVEHQPYRGLELTRDGRLLAVDVVRRHRLLETYLVGALGYGWDEVHEEAEVLEHAISPLLLERIDVALARPVRDPHGDPIPTADGDLHQPSTRPLGDLLPGESGYVARIVDDDGGLLRHLDERGVVLDAHLRLVEQRPFGGPTVVETGAGRVDLGLQAVAAIWVAAARPDADARPGECPFPECRLRHG